MSVYSPLCRCTRSTCPPTPLATSSPPSAGPAKSSDNHNHHYNDDHYNDDHYNDDHYNNDHYDDDHCDDDHYDDDHCDDDHCDNEDDNDIEMMRMTMILLMPQHLELIRLNEPTGICVILIPS